MREAETSRGGFVSSGAPRVEKSKSSFSVKTQFSPPFGGFGWVRFARFCNGETSARQTGDAHEDALDVRGAAQSPAPKSHSSPRNLTPRARTSAPLGPAGS